MKVNRIFILLVSLVITLGCSLPYIALPQSGGNSPDVRYRLITADPDATASPTPFQPVTQTPRPGNPATATAQAVIQLTQTTPTVSTNETTPLTPTVRPVVTGQYPEGQVRILVLGSDARPGGGFRTDIIMLVSINPKHGSATVLSFPRDLWVDLPGWGANRINTAMVYGGFSLMANTLENNFGIRPTHYVMTNFDGFTQIINSLGGVDVTASQTLRDVCKLPQAVGGYCTVNPGTSHMNGAFALWYVRSRYSTNDFDRERRSQEVLQAAFNKLMNLNAIGRIPELYNIYKKNVETNLSLSDVAALAPVGSQLISDRSKIRRYAISPKEASDWTVPGSGAMVLLPNKALIQQIIQQAIFTP
jgi:LCP family protein required for cell wall assembly